ncbi:MAG: CoA transferase [Rhodobacteraceae bacterium]|nr:CoA transferase [Paracoccaceae bacterium]
MNAYKGIGTATDQGQSLSGVRVLDLGRYIAAPYCAHLLACHGADVIRIEPPQGASDREVMPVGIEGRGGLYLQVNSGKKSLSLDYSRPSGRAVLERLIAESDILIVNLPRSTLEKLRLDYDSLKAINPSIILTTISAFDFHGESCNKVGFDGTGQALSGAMFLTGSGDHPTRAAVSYVDYGTALGAAFATMSAVLQRRITGEGQHVTCSLMGTALTMMNPMLMEEASGSRSRRPIGNRSPIAGPSDLFATRDGWIMIQIIGDPMFSRWARMMDRTDLLGDPRFATDSDRGENGEFLSAITAEWCAQRTLAECMDELERSRLPCCQCLTPDEALRYPGLDDYAEPIQVDGATVTLPLITRAMRTANWDGRNPDVAPALGADTDTILAGLGIRGDALQMLRKEGVI